MVCKDCIKSTVEEFYPEATCPVLNCEGKILDLEVKNVLGEKDFDELQLKMVN